MKHVLIAVSALLVVLADQLLRGNRQRRAISKRPPPEQAIEEHLSTSGRFKAVVYAHYGDVMRVEMFKWIANDPTAPLWLRVSGSSFVDRQSLAPVVYEGLRAAGGEVELTRHGEEPL